MPSIEHVLELLFMLVLVTVGAGLAAAALLRYRRLSWTWAAFGLPIALLIFEADAFAGFALGSASLIACWLGAHWHHHDLHHGGDLAEAARARIGPLALARRLHHARRTKRGGWATEGWLTVGHDDKGLSVAIPIGRSSGSHALVLGATGSGKTVTEAWVACRLIEQGHGAIAVDPKGDRLLRDELEAAAARVGAQFLEWTPEGPLAYNPYSRGSESEIADKALAGERFTEPHYLRQAQRYLGHAVRAMHAAKVAVTPSSLMANLEPAQLEVTARELADPDAETVQRYLDSLTERQRRELAGVRDRLSILAESDVRRWLEPSATDNAIDLASVVAQRSVVYFRLDSDRRALLSQLLAAAIVSDLVTLVADLQSSPAPTVVLIDEFSAVAAEQVASLFGRARSAGISLILATQELADLKGAGEGLREQVLGNAASVIAHRQNVPESAELIAAMAGTHPAWITTAQTKEGLIGTAPSGRGTQRRGYEYEIHPSQIKRLPTGWAAVLAPGSGKRPTIARICHPAEASP